MVSRNPLFDTTREPLKGAEGRADPSPAGFMLASLMAAGGLRWPKRTSPKLPPKIASLLEVRWLVHRLRLAQAPVADLGRSERSLS